MSEYALRIVVEKVDLADEENILSRETLTKIDINSPDNIIDLGFAPRSPNRYPSHVTG